MEFSDVVRQRRMVRDFDERPLPPDAVNRILAVAMRGPSSGFTQGFEFLVFEGPVQTARFWQAVPWWDQPKWDGARRAPLIIVPLAHEEAYVETYRRPERAEFGRKSGEDFPSPYWFIDTAFAAMLVLLSAVDEGLGGFYFSIGPTSKEIPRFIESLGIPHGYYPIGAIAVGYPGGSHGPQSAKIVELRRPPSAMIHRGGW
jgi:nitroreductase